MKKILKIDKLKKERKEPSQIDRHFGVILEDINFKLDLVVEGCQVLDRKIDKIDEKLEKFIFLFKKRVEALERSEK